GTSPDVVAKLNAEVRKLLAQADVRARLEREGVELVPGAPEQLGTMIEADLTGWKKLIADFGLRFE
ncbi:MAG: tripartite tricarboxylate transporter substrate-binding protein, partial [Casimicrobiaceae bacterium]